MTPNSLASKIAGPVQINNEEYRSLQSAVSYRASMDEEIYELEGDEREKFLQAYTTQNIQSLPKNQVLPAAFLTQKGKIVSSVWMIQLPKKILLLLPSGFGTKLEEHLSTFLMFSSVTLKKANAAWAHLAFLGPQAKDLLETLFSQSFPEKEASLIDILWEEIPLQLFFSHRLGPPAWEILAPASQQNLLVEKLALLKTKFGLRTLSDSTLDLLRIEAGVPQMGLDIREDHLVAEVGLDQKATSFNKGCYLGQEITARVQSRGQLHRKLFSVKLSGGECFDLPADIWQDDKIVGRLTSAVTSPRLGKIGLAMLPLRSEVSAGPFYLKTAAGKTIIEIDLERNKNA